MPVSALVVTPRHEALADLISTPRLAPFLRVAHGDVVVALRLYRWNIDMSAAVYEMLHVVEVVLRNAIDRRLREWNAAQVDRTARRQNGEDWTLDPARLLRRLVGQDLVKALARARNAAAQSSGGPRRVTHDDVVAQLTMGTWRYLLPDRDPGRRRLWADAVSAAFPHLTRPVEDVVADVDGLYRLRNRVAHLEPLAMTGIVVPQFVVARRVLAEIHPHVEEWMVSHQRVTSVARLRPVGRDIPTAPSAN